MAGITTSLSGLAGARANVKATRAKLRSSSVGAGIKSAAEKLRSKVEDAAPKGPTGNLKRAIKADTNPAFATRITASNLAQYVYVDLKIAPHTFLIEFGTAQRKQKGGRRTGAIDPPQPFFRPTVASSRNEVRRLVEGTLRKAIQ